MGPSRRALGEKKTGEDQNEKIEMTSDDVKARANRRIGHPLLDPCEGATPWGLASRCWGGAMARCHDFVREKEQGNFRPREAQGQEERYDGSEQSSEGVSRLWASVPAGIAMLDHFGTVRTFRWAKTVPKKMTQTTS
jgi:hypothetical protein